MSDLKQILGFKPMFNFNKIQAYRDENDNMASVMLGNRELMLSNAMIIILKKCNGENTIEEIVNQQHAVFPNIGRNEMLRDVCSIVHYLTMIQVITWEGVNPFLPGYSKGLDDGYKVFLGDYQSVSKAQELISKMMNNELGKSYLYYFNPYHDEREFSLNFLREACSNPADKLFLLEKDNQIEGLIMTRISSGTSVNTPMLIICSRNGIGLEMFLDSVNEAVIELYGEKVTKSRLYKCWHNENIIVSMQLKGYRPMCTLKNELGSHIDVVEYDYIY